MAEWGSDTCLSRQTNPSPSRHFSVIRLRDSSRIKKDGNTMCWNALLARLGRDHGSNLADDPNVHRVAV